MVKPKWKVVKLDRTSAVVSVDNIYCLHYLKGKIVKAKKNSFGVFCFNRKYDARNFMNDLSLNDLSLMNYQIIKVEPLCKGKTPKFLFNPKLLKRSYELLCEEEVVGSINHSIPNGTICYDKIKVLE